MPQLVKGGKHVFGWSKVDDRGRIRISSEAFAEYRLNANENVFLISGSRASGGFGLTKPESLRASPLSLLLDECPDLARYIIPAGTAVRWGKKTCCWVKMGERRFRLPPDTLACFGIRPGDRLLLVRGSGLALGFIARGPIVEPARRHSELETC